MHSELCNVYKKWLCVIIIIIIIIIILNLLYMVQNCGFLCKVSFTVFFLPV